MPNYDQFADSSPVFDVSGKNEEGPVDPEKGHNGHQCWQCREDNYADCQTHGKIVNCKSEQFHCNIRENRKFGVVTKVNMGRCLATIDFAPRVIHCIQWYTDFSLSVFGQNLNIYENYNFILIWGQS